MDMNGEINEYYFKKVISRAIIFKQTEKLVIAQPWYTNGYRANIVIYTLAYLSYYLKSKNKILDYLKLWKEQSISESFEKVLVELTREINLILTRPNQVKTTTNISEWAKKDACWGTILAEATSLNMCINKSFLLELVDNASEEGVAYEAKNKQKFTDSISVQDKINAINKYFWRDLLNYLDKEHNLSFKDKGILKMAGMGKQDLSVKQCFVLDRIKTKYGEEFERYNINGKETLFDW